MSVGEVCIIDSSQVQKIDAKSSTEAEVVGVDDMMPQALWTKCFLDAQDCGVKESVVHQDDQTAVLLEQNSKGSSGKRTKHTNVFFCQRPHQERQNHS